MLKKKAKKKVKKRLNRGAIENMKLKHLNEVDPDGEALTWLTKISRHLQ